MNIFRNLNQNLSYLKNYLNSDDVFSLDISINNTDAKLIFVDDLTDKKTLGDLVIKPLEQYKSNIKKDELFNTFLFPQKKIIYQLDHCLSEIFSGNAVLFCDKLNCAFSFEAKQLEKRAITEPPTSAVIKGPREGFVENLSVNISLLRKRIKTHRFKVNMLKIGKYSQTPISICYIKGIADQKIVNFLKHKLSSIDIDAIIDSSYITKFLNPHKTSLFKQLGNTEKPDILTAKLLEGRVAILVDGSPIALSLPYVLWEDFQSPSDYYNSAYFATFARAIRVVSVSISVLLPAFFVSAELFHLQLIPLPFLLTIVNSIKGIPLSPSHEMIFTLLIFEILNEASVRMPRYVGMVVSIVGGLVLGETAVSAGIISAPTLMIIALSGICLFTVPELEQTFSIIRLLLLLIGGSIGCYGLLIFGSFIIIYIVSFESFGTPIFAPFAPLITKDLKDGIYKGFIIEQENRPLSIQTKNKRRLKIK